MDYTYKHVTAREGVLRCLATTDQYTEMAFLCVLPGASGDAAVFGKYCKIIGLPLKEPCPYIGTRRQQNRPLVLWL